jgi:transcriptional regulator with XRE-family HTH domain
MMSSITDTDSDGDLSDRIASRIRSLRTERGYSLDTLASKSGVSRSAISMIERSETNPTAVVLERLATGLDIPLASLFDPPAQSSPSPVSRRSQQSSWRDPQSGYVRRNVSPVGRESPIQIVEVDFPPGATISYETADRDVVIHQQVWVLSGTIEVTLETETYSLEQGDCLSMIINQPITFKNPATKKARYAVVVVANPLRTKRAS